MKNITIDCTALNDDEFSALNEMLFAGYEASKRFADWFYFHVPFGDKTNAEYRSINGATHECMDAWLSITRQRPLPALV